MEILIYLGIALMIGGNVWLLVRGFMESIAWGLGMLLLPFIGLVFLIVHWDKAKHPFLVTLSGLAICFVSFALGGDSVQAAP